MKALLLLPVVLLALVAAGCGTGGDEPSPTAGPPAATSATPSSGAAIPGGGLSVDEALASKLEGPLMVAGFLVAAGDEVRLCSALAESYPPQCGGSSLLVEGLNLATVEGLQMEGVVSWTDERFSVLGDVRDGVLTVSATSI